MRLPRFGFRRPTGFHRNFLSAATGSFLILIFLSLTAPRCCAQEVRRPDGTVRRWTVTGLVSLPDDKPAQNVRVKLLSQDGGSRETITNDNGRYEFADVPEGTYMLSANGIKDSSLSSESVQTNTNRTATGTLYVNLALRETTTRAADKKKSKVVSVAEVDQKVPKAARKAFLQGLKFKSDKQADEALKNLNQAIELYPDYFQALAERGDLYVSERRITEAAVDFERALKLNSHYEPALRGAGYCKLESKEFKDAAEYLEQATGIDGTNATTQLLLGIANLELDHRDLALQALQKALSIDAQRAVRAHIYLGNLYAREHEYVKAADELHAYLEAMPNDSQAEELRKVEAQWRARGK